MERWTIIILVIVLLVCIGSAAFMVQKYLSRRHYWDLRAVGRPVVAHGRVSSFPNLPGGMGMYKTMFGGILSDAEPIWFTTVVGKDGTKLPQKSTYAAMVKFRRYIGNSTNANVSLIISFIANESVTCRTTSLKSTSVGGHGDYYVAPNSGVTTTTLTVPPGGVLLEFFVQHSGASLYPGIFLFVAKDAKNKNTVLVSDKSWVYERIN